MPFHIFEMIIIKPSGISDNFEKHFMLVCYNVSIFMIHIQESVPSNWKLNICNEVSRISEKFTLKICDDLSTLNTSEFDFVIFTLYQITLCIKIFFLYKLLKKLFWYLTMCLHLWNFTTSIRSILKICLIFPVSCRA